MISPTGKGIRYDSIGYGYYGAKRANRYHKGADYICVPGQNVVSPIDGEIIRIAKPYSNAPYSGLLIRGSRICIKLFYFEPTVSPGDTVKAGDVIGTAQDISQRYSDKMVPHVHLEIDDIDPELLMRV